ncbi:MAG: hypothetical protein IJ368_04685 [Oscillospiraceae bacterium]|nr:hypothetical protein [Oscillospiraceae bacterium]
MKIYRFIAPLMAAIMLTACGDSQNTLGSSGSEETAVSADTAQISEQSSVTTVTTITTTSAATTTATEITTAPPTETTTETTTELPFEDTPDNAYRRLNMAFVSDKGTVYPDDYAGSYSFGRTLFVVITTASPSDFYKGLLSEYTCVKYKTAANSLNRLTEIAEKAAELLEPEFGVAEYYVDVPSNKAAVAIINKDPKSAQNYLKSVEDIGFTLGELEISMAETESETAE